jgi:hypothetical protein
MYLGFAALSLSPPIANANSNTTECYEYTSEDTPFAEASQIEKKEVWCYKNFENQPGKRLIYSIDDKGRAIPELSFLVESTGVITHLSLLNGEHTFHRFQSYTDSQFSPVPVPLEPSSEAKRIIPPISPSSVISVDQTLQSLSNTAVQIDDLSIRTEGNFHSAVAETSLPWRGYWFPHSSGRLHNGVDSPMAKLDRFISQRSSGELGAQKWEKLHHADHTLKWAGHCNGWAAASILRKEPTAAWTDPITNIEFTVSDLKGLLMEREYCPKTAFYGHRNLGKPKDDPKDIAPALFHNTIRYYLGELKKPVLMDYDPGTPVENRVISGYDMSIKKISNNYYHVEASLTVHTYDTHASNDVGVAPAVEKKYIYNVTTDNDGNVLRGVWLSKNPDFLWVPLATGSCKSQNPAVTELWANALQSAIPDPW